MKLVWFSPRAPMRSDIANFTARLEPELRRRFDMRFLTEDAAGFQEPGARRSYPVALGDAPSKLLRSLNAAEVPVYNLGNNADFHAHTLFLSQCKPGIVILHDVRLHHFADSVFRLRLRDRERYLALMERHYGALGLEAGRLYWRGKIFIDYMTRQFPLVGWAVANALAVIAHTPHAREAVERQSYAPTWENALPYPASERTPTRPAGPFQAERPARLVIFGYLNANRRVVELLGALAAMEERAAFEVHVYGAFEEHYGREVRESVERFGLQDRVFLHGYVSGEELEAGVARGDLAVNLRYPTMGEASGSLLRIWDHALPCLVTQTDAYAALPAEAVRFVRPEHERADIQRHLRDFLARPGEFQSLGEHGREILLARHRPETYVERLETLCGQLDTLRSRHTRMWAAERVGERAASWLQPAAMAREEFYAACIAGAF